MRQRLGFIVFGVLVLCAGLAQAEVFEFGAKRQGKIFNAFDLAEPDPGACRDACDGDPQCKAWTFVNEGEQGPNARCLLQSTVKQPVKDACCVSGLSGGGGTQDDDDMGGADIGDDADVVDAPVAGQLPRGSWRKTCRNGRIEGTELVAECEGHNGDFNTAELDLRRCPGSAVSNDKGKLKCGEPGAGDGDAAQDGGGTAGVGGLPAGSWQQDCTLLGLMPTELMADCPDNDGVPSTSTIDPTTCPGTISNIDGFLVCDQ